MTKSKTERNEPGARPHPEQGAPAQPSGEPQKADPICARCKQLRSDHGEEPPYDLVYGENDDYCEGFVYVAEPPARVELGAREFGQLWAKKKFGRVPEFTFDKLEDVISPIHACEFAEAYHAHKQASPVEGEPREKEVAEILRDAKERVQPVIDSEAKGEQVGAIMDFRMKGMSQKETFDWLLERHRKLLEIEEAQAAPSGEPRANCPKPKCPQCGEPMEDAMKRFSANSASAVRVFCEGKDLSHHQFQIYRLSDFAQFFPLEHIGEPAPITAEELACAYYDLEFGEAAQIAGGTAGLTLWEDLDSFERGRRIKQADRFLMALASLQGGKDGK